jgi:hypothetical protein
MRPPQHGRPGVIGDHHGLTRLTHALEALEAGQRQQETRDTQIRAQLATQAALLTQLVRWGRYQRYSLVGLGLLTLTLSGLVGWQVWHPPSRAMPTSLGRSMPRSGSSGGHYRKRCRKPSGPPMAGAGWSALETVRGRASSPRRKTPAPQATPAVRGYSAPRRGCGADLPGEATPRAAAPQRGPRLCGARGVVTRAS